MALYPTIYAGQKITGSLLQSMLPNVIYKTTSEDRQATTTLTADSDLQVALDANAVYHVTMYIHYATPTAAGFQTDWSVPSGASGGRSSLGNGSSQHDYQNVPGNFGVHNFNTSVTHGDRASSTNQLILLEEGLVTTTTAGTLALRWAQVVSTAANTRVGSNSVMYVRRLA
ncbi:hypothetical protein ACWET9_22450 [Streptomyces sp. NPDC004059]